MGHCERFKEHLLDFIDHDIDILHKKEIKRHIEECADCECLMRQMRVLRSQLRSLPRMKASDNFNVILRDCIRRERAGKRSYATSRVFVVSRFIPAVGLAIVVISFGIWTFAFKKSQNPNMQAASGANETTVPRIERTGGQVQYVIDDYPSRISVSRDDGETSRQIRVPDSMSVEDQRERIRPPLTTVSF